MKNGIETRPVAAGRSERHGEDDGVVHGFLRARVLARVNCARQGREQCDTNGHAHQTLRELIEIVALGDPGVPPH